MQLKWLYGIKGAKTRFLVVFWLCLSIFCVCVCVCVHVQFVHSSISSFIIVIYVLFVLLVCLIFCG